MYAPGKAPVTYHRHPSCSHKVRKYAFGFPGIFTGEEINPTSVQWRVFLRTLFASTIQSVGNGMEALFFFDARDTNLLLAS